ATRFAEHDDRAAGHVLTTVIAAALDDCGRARVAHREPLARDTAEKHFAGDGSVEHRVADDDVLLGHEAGLSRWIDDDATAGEALADIVVCLPLELQRDAAREKRAEALPGRADRADTNRVVWQSRVPVPSRHFAGKHGTDCTVNVANGDLERDGH